MSLGITKLNGAFAGATTLEYLPNNVSGIVEMNFMLSGATIFDSRSLETWNYGEVTNMTGMLTDCGISTDNFNRLMITFANLVSSGDMGSELSIGANNIWYGDIEYTDEGSFTNAKSAIDYLTSSGGWDISGAKEAMVLVFDTSKNTGTSIQLPFRGATDCFVDWGDGSSESFLEENSTTSKPHTYEIEGKYTVIITGSLFRFGEWDWGGKVPGTEEYASRKLVEFRSFGDLGISKLDFAIVLSPNITYIPNILPTSVVSIHGVVAAGSTSGSGYAAMENWDVSNIEGFGSIFWMTGPSFPIDLTSWDTSNGKNFTHTLAAGNNMVDVSSFTYGKAENMVNFANNGYFNQEITWTDFRNVTKFATAFYNTSSYNYSFGNFQLRVSGVDMTNMISRGGLNTENYNKTLIGFANYVRENGGPHSSSFGAEWLSYDDEVYPEYAEDFYDNAVDAREFLTASSGAMWTIVGDFPPWQCTVLEYVILEGEYEIVLEPRGTELSYRIDMGNGSRGKRFTQNGNVIYTTSVGPTGSHINPDMQYTEAGTYLVKIAGNYQTYGKTTATSYIDKLARVLKISESVTALPGAWRDAVNLTEIPENVTWVTNVSYMLSGATTYAGTELATWDCSIWTDATGLLDNTAISVSDYDSILAAWAATITAAEIGEGEQEITVGVDGLVYSAAALTDISTLETAGWTFVGHTQETP